MCQLTIPVSVLVAKLVIIGTHISAYMTQKTLPPAVTGEKSPRPIDSDRMMTAYTASP